MTDKAQTLLFVWKRKQNFTRWPQTEMNLSRISQHRTFVCLRKSWVTVFNTQHLLTSVTFRQYWKVELQLSHKSFISLLVFLFLIFLKLTSKSKQWKTSPAHHCQGVWERENSFSAECHVILRNKGMLKEC